MNATRPPTISAALTKANRQRWASINLHDRAVQLCHAGEFARAFRFGRASERCRILANQSIHRALTTARAA